MLELYPKNEQDWHGAIIRMLIVGFFICQLAVRLVVPRISSGHPSPRVSAALQAHAGGPKAELYAAIAEARRQDQIQAHRWDVVESTVLLAVDVLLLYCLWNVEIRKQLTPRESRY